MREHSIPLEKHSAVNFTAVVVAVCGGVLLTAAVAAGMRSTKSDAFSAAQAERGKEVYDKSCGNCHQEDFYRERLPRWENKPVAELFEALATTMPADNVGALSDAEYIDVLAYIFSITGSKAGQSELTADTMASIAIARPE
jgi:S-disulfanyl-L-cysteine oxidoreductase SoxD